MIDRSGTGLIIVGAITLLVVGIAGFFSRDKTATEEWLNNRKVQGSSSNTVEDAVNSFRESVNSLSSNTIGKSKSSSLSMGGSRRKCKKGGKRKTKGRK